ncbi:MAG: histidinol phosphate phosphatase domain-containing protein [Methanosarcinales archaeon Met12]|nr:MAG: histidinol phosphate phosphatase domain-containing protein [Methanosarcinales archaeon Met12]
MIDLHSHTTFSDGELIPAELVRRAVVQGYAAIGLTDHVDFSNVEYVLTNLKKMNLEGEMNIRVVIGVEITHIPPAKIEKLVTKAKQLGAELIVIHGETMMEPVAPGTNSAAVRLGDVDILSHPGFISIEDAEIARDNEVYLEITSRQGHCMTNGYVAKIANEAGAMLVVNSDAHSPTDLITKKKAVDIAMAAGLDKNDADKATGANPLKLLKSLGAKTVKGTAFDYKC